MVEMAGKKEAECALSLALGKAQAQGWPLRHLQSTGLSIWFLKKEVGGPVLSGYPCARVVSDHLRSGLVTVLCHWERSLHLEWWDGACKAFIKKTCFI